MAKVRTAYVCQSCGAQFPQWRGQCGSCQEWNTLQEEIIDSGASAAKGANRIMSQALKQPVAIGSVAKDHSERYILDDAEFNRVLGGGMVQGSVVLLGGSPGVGKSTLSLQTALELKLKVAYVSGEESEQQIAMRAERLGSKNPELMLVPETQTQAILEHLKNIKPGLVVVDSIQTLHSNLLEAAPGSVSQIRQTAAELTQYAKSTNTPLLLIGHITKEGQLAGPKVLEHMVDTVLQFEGDRNYNYRILRALKNRFGPTSEIGIYEMRRGGLHQVQNPSEMLLSERDEAFSGVAVAATLEGNRPLLVEIQALVSSAVYGNPQRSATGFDLRRMNMLLAVLEKRCGFKLGIKDVFLNVTGGLRISDPATDLAVACAVLSSSEDLPIDHRSCFAAEVGLTGEIRPVNQLEQRIQEAEKLGFKRIFISSYARIDKASRGIEVIPCAKIEDTFQHLFS
jgi:DNA repair protein RadA/Sms